MGELFNSKNEGKIWENASYCLKCILLVFSIALISPSYSAMRQSNNDTCMSSFKNHSDTAFPVCIKEAMKGDADAQYSVGLMYINGDGEANYKNGLNWFTKAADKGHKAALNRLTAIYTIGEFVPKNLKKVFEVNLKAAKSGNTTSQSNVGYLYKTGTGTSINLKESFYWYSKAAEKGMASAQNALGYFYQNGEVKPKDVKKAFEWHLKAANQGYLGSIMRIANMYFEGVGVQKNEQKSFDWYLKAAEEDYGTALFMVGLFFENSIGVKKDLELALHYYSLAVCQGENLGIKERNRVKKELENKDGQKLNQGSELILVCSLMFDTELILTHTVDLKNYKVNDWNAYISEKTIKWTANDDEFSINRYSGRHDGFIGIEKQRVTGTCEKVTEKLF